MTEPLPDTWHHRDLLVLRAAVRLFDESIGGVVRAEALEHDTGLSADDVQRAGIALRDAGLISVEAVSGLDMIWVKGISPNARQLTGAWPSPESIADRLLATLQDIADHGSDEVTKSRARKALDGLGSLTRDTLVSVAGAAAGVAMQ